LLLSNIDEKSSTTAQTSMESFVDKNLPMNEAIAIHRQLLRMLLSANVSFSFVDNPEVNKLFKMLRPSYELPSRKWISTEILDQVHKEIEGEIKKFAADAKFLTLSGDGWTNVSKQSMVNFILTNEKHQSQIWKVENFSNVHHTGDIMFEAYKKVGMEFGTDKWVGFVSDSGPDMVKAQRLIREVSFFIIIVFKFY
jgi:hypothetical protein